MSTTLQRCPRCGNENRLNDYACSFCGKRLRVEKIERIPFLKRIEAEWTNPYPWWKQLYLLFISPNLAFWDINHNRKKSPGNLILIFSSFLYGLMGPAILSHFNTPFDPLTGFMFGLSFYIVFFLFGLFFQFLLFKISIWLYTKGANYSVDFSERLEERFGFSIQEEEKFSQRELSPFSIYKGGILLQKQEANKSKMMMCAFAPFIVINFIKFIILMINFPSINISGTIPNEAAFVPILTAPVWIVIDTIDALTIAIWIPLLITLAIRELSNSSTYKVIIPSYILSILIAVFVFFLRPSFVA